MFIKQLQTHKTQEQIYGSWLAFHLHISSLDPLIHFVNHQFMQTSIFTRVHVFKMETDSSLKTWIF